MDLVCLCFTGFHGALFQANHFLVPFREACINFVELCKKKNEDRLWMDEIAAMQTYPQPELPYMGTSGIILAGEENEPNPNISINVNRNTLSDSSTSHGSSDVNQGMFQYCITLSS